MVYIDSWLDFLTQAKDLYIQRPAETRYTVKYRPADAEIVLKVTDDRTCLQFRSHLQSDLRYVDKINSAFFKLMTAKQPQDVSLVDELSEERKIDKKSSSGGGPAAVASPQKQQQSNSQNSKSSKKKH